MAYDPLTVLYTTPLVISNVFLKGKAIRRAKKSRKGIFSHVNAV